MSESSAITHSVLLPTAKISLFVKDDALKAAAMALRDDWRFARVVIDVVDGNIEDAISLYSQSVSPELVFVETSEISDAFTGRLEILGGHCAENTSAVVIGPVNDVYLYRKMIDMGISDYLVKPVSRDVLSDVFSKILIEKLGASDSKLIACIGSKGGVGASTFSHLLANVSANNLHQKTIILDASGGYSYLSVAMGGESLTTLHEVARAAVSSDKDSFNRMIVSVNDKLSYLGTGAESLLDDSVGADNFEVIINRLMQTYPVVVVDLSASPVDIRRTVLSRAYEVVVVSTPTLAALRSARGLIQEIKTLRGGTEQGVHIVLNMRGTGSGFEISDTDMEAALKIKSSLTVPFLPKTFGGAEGQGKNLAQVSGGSDVVSLVQRFVQEKLGFTADKSATVTSTPSSFMDGFLSKVLKKS